MKGHRYVLLAKGTFKNVSFQKNMPDGQKPNCVKGAGLTRPIDISVCDAKKREGGWECRKLIPGLGLSLSGNFNQDPGPASGLTDQLSGIHNHSWPETILISFPGG